MYIIQSIRQGIASVMIIVQRLCVQLCCAVFLPAYQKDRNRELVNSGAAHLQSGCGENRFVSSIIFRQFAAETFCGEAIKLHARGQCNMDLIINLCHRCFLHCPTVIVYVFPSRFLGF